MIYEGKEHVLFEEDVILNDLVTKFYIIEDEITRKRMPRGPKTYIQMFKDRYKVELSEEEFTELKDYALNEYITDIPSQIQVDFQSGRITRLRDL
ncbi:MAG TPA: hypothetical protein VHO03_16805 [Ignavibacteriales bacterium]|nr:hypothetical protein [Ignavibacteriales bacterium]